MGIDRSRPVVFEVDFNCATGKVRQERARLKNRQTESVDRGLAIADSPREVLLATRRVSLGARPSVLPAGQPSDRAGGLW
jgi:hypothetical protein